MLNLEQGSRAALSLGAVLALTGALPGWAQEACTTYTVQAGDTLGEI